ncbi:MAG: hypothetical protein MRZ40_09975 [Ligilactobacillus animalis]|uniref:hypothetical protein n=1 Tax=Ligilactobacillus animalis TaxID=1605 RepID=UPI00242EA917|nr:hypothetical protein [Ligilactobacillus animalis]MCI5942880.1 hypothetical protein [Ligilactobacillus animalis]MDY2992548.1 hypothetical protein [Ligilactobacillus animalis]
MSKKWYEALDQEDVIFLHQLAQADFKLSDETGMSYFVLKKRMQKLKLALSQKTPGDSDFKSYLDFLVEQRILPQSIAKVLYQKHLEGLD